MASTHPTRSSAGKFGVAFIEENGVLCGPSAGNSSNSVPGFREKSSNEE